MSTLNLGSTIKVAKSKPKNKNQRGHKPASSAAQRTKALTVKFTADEYKQLQLKAIEQELSHQDLIHNAVIAKI